jgi:acyl-CoA reductase-like NAD-dependent aldehyde dehydrogenase
VRFPYDGSLVDTVCLARESDIDAAIEHARWALPVTRAMSSGERANVLRHIVRELTAMREELANLLCLENGKTIREARMEVSRCIATFEVGVGEAERLYGETFDLGITNMSRGRFAITKPFPVGIVAGIVPFNFPLNLAAHKIAPALAAGCPIILKPATSTPLSLLRLAEIVENSGWPVGAFSVVPCDRMVGQKLVEDPRIALLSFTGSPEVGWRMKAAAGTKRVVLELGGNAACVVGPDVRDWDYVFSRLMIGAYYQAGQSCISVQRIYCHESVYSEFRERLVAEIAQLQLGDPRDESTFVGSMIDAKNADRIKAWVDEAVSLGGTLLAGGSKLSDTLVEPTLLEGVPAAAQAVSEEAFGPLAVLSSFSDWDALVAEINSSKFGLQVGLFSNHLPHVWKLFEEVEVGGVIHGDVPNFRADNMPYGGVKDSGFGREGVRYAIRDYVEEKLLVIDTSFKA